MNSEMVYGLTTSTFKKKKIVKHSYYYYYHPIIDCNPFQINEQDNNI